MEKQEFISAYNKCLNYLSIAQRSSWQIYRYLTQKDYDEEVIDLVIKALTQRNLLDDDAYAVNTVCRYKERESKRALKSRLRSAGIEDDIIDKSLIYDEGHCASVVAKRYIRSRVFDKVKLRNYLFCKGFGSDSITYAIDQCLKEE